MREKPNTAAAMSAAHPPDDDSGCIDRFDTEKRADGYAVIETRTRRTVSLMGKKQEGMERGAAFDLCMWLNLSNPEPEDEIEAPENIEETLKQVRGDR